MPDLIVAGAGVVSNIDLICLRSLLLKRRAEIFEIIGVKLHYISFGLRILQYLAVNLPWKFFDILIGFEMAAFIKFEAVTSSDF